MGWLDALGLAAVIGVGVFYVVAVLIEEEADSSWRTLQGPGVIAWRSLAPDRARGRRLQPSMSVGMVGEASGRSQTATPQRRTGLRKGWRYVRRDLVPRLVGIIAATPVAVGFFLLGAVVLVGRSLRDALRGTRAVVPDEPTNPRPTGRDALREVEQVIEFPTAEGMETVGTTQRDREPLGAGDSTDWLDEVASALSAPATTIALVDDVVRVFLSDARAFFGAHPDAETCEQVEAGVRKRAVAVGKAVRILMWPAGAEWDAHPAVDQTFRVGEVP